MRNLIIMQISAVDVGMKTEDEKTAASGYSHYCEFVLKHIKEKQYVGYNHKHGFHLSLYGYGPELIFFFALV